MTPTINTTNSINTNNTNNTNKVKGEKAAAAAAAGGQEERGVKRPLPVPKKRAKGTKPILKRAQRTTIGGQVRPAVHAPIACLSSGVTVIEMVDIDMIGIDATGTDMIGTDMIGIDIDMRAPNRRSTSRPKHYFE